MDSDGLLKVTELSLLEPGLELGLCDVKDPVLPPRSPLVNVLPSWRAEISHGAALPKWACLIIHGGVMALGQLWAQSLWISSHLVVRGLIWKENPIYSEVEKNQVFLPISFEENREKTHSKAVALHADLFLNQSLC